VHCAVCRSPDETTQSSAGFQLADSAKAANNLSLAASKFGKA